MQRDADVAAASGAPATGGYSPTSDAGDSHAAWVSPAASTRLLWLAAATVLSLHAALVWMLRQPSITTIGDDALYLLLGRSLRAFHYRELFYAGAPLHSQYPPVYPALLAIAGAVGGERLGVLIAVGILASLVGLFALFVTVRRQWSSSTVAFVVLALVALNPSLVQLAGMIMSEAPFFCFSVGAIALLARPNPGRWTLVAAGALAVAAALTRGIGITVVAAVGLHWVLQRRWRAVVVLGVACALTVAPWLVWSVRAPVRDAQRSYAADATVGMRDRRSAGPIATVAQRIAANAPEYGVRQLPAALPVPAIRDTAVDNWVALIVIVTLGLMGMRELWRRWRAAALYLLCYGALLLVWPWALDRFLVPAIPIVIVAVVAGAVVGGRDLKRIPVYALLGLVALGIGGAAVAEDAAAIGLASSCDRAAPMQSAGCFNVDQRSFFAAALYAARSTPPAALFALAGKQADFYYVSGRTTVPPATAGRGTAEERLRNLQQAGVGYVLATHVSGADLRFATMLGQACGRLRLVSAFAPRTYLFRIAMDDPPEPNGAACRATADYRRDYEPWYPVRYW